MEPHEDPSFWAGPEGRVLADAVLHEHLRGGDEAAVAAPPAVHALAPIGAHNDAAIDEWQEKATAASAANPNMWKMQNDVYDRCGKLAGYLDQPAVLNQPNGKTPQLHVGGLVFDASRAIMQCHHDMLNSKAGGDLRKPKTTKVLFEEAAEAVMTRLSAYPPTQTQLNAEDLTALKVATYVTRVPHVNTLRPWQLRVLAAIFHNPLSNATNPNFDPKLTTRAALINVWQFRGLRAGVAEAYRESSKVYTTQCALDRTTRRHPAVYSQQTNSEVGMGSRFQVDKSGLPGWIEAVQENAGALPEMKMQQQWVVTGGGAFPGGKATTWLELMAQIRARLRSLHLLLGDQTTNLKAGAAYRIRLLTDVEVEAILNELQPELLGWSPSADGLHQPRPSPNAATGSWWDSILRWAEGEWNGKDADMRPGPLRTALAVANNQSEQLLTVGSLLQPEYGQPLVLQRAMDAARGLSPLAFAPSSSSAPAAAPADPQADFPYRLVETPDEAWNAKKFPYQQVAFKNMPDMAPAIFFASMRGYVWALTVQNDLDAISEDAKTKFDYENRFHRYIRGPGVMRYKTSTPGARAKMREYIRDGWTQTPPRRIAMACREKREPMDDGQYVHSRPTAWDHTTLIMQGDMYNPDVDSIGMQTLKHSPWDDPSLQFDNDVYTGPLYGDGPVRTTWPTFKDGAPALSRDDKVVANMGNASGMEGTHIWFHHHCSYTGEWKDDLPHGWGRFVHGLFRNSGGLALSPPFIWVGEWRSGRRTNAIGWLGQLHHDVAPSLASSGWAGLHPSAPGLGNAGINPDPPTGITWQKGRYPQGGSFVPYVETDKPLSDPTEVLARSDATATRVMAQTDDAGVVAHDGSSTADRTAVRDALRKLAVLRKEDLAVDGLADNLRAHPQMQGRTLLTEVDDATLQEFRAFFAVTDPRHLGQGNDANNYATTSPIDPANWSQPAGVLDLQGGRPKYGQIVPLKVFRVGYDAQFTAPDGADPTDDAAKVRMKDQYSRIRSTIEEGRRTTRYTRKRIMPAQRRSEQNPRGVGSMQAGGLLVATAEINSEPFTAVDKYFCDAQAIDAYVDTTNAADAKADAHALDDEIGANVPDAERKFHKLARPAADWPTAAAASRILGMPTIRATLALRDTDTRVTDTPRVNAQGDGVGLLLAEVKTRTGALARTGTKLREDLIFNSSNQGLSADANETLLLHGTSSTNAALILTGGFASRFASQPYYGLGLYFAEEPSKCDQYGKLAYGSATTQSKSADLGMRALLGIGSADLQAAPPALTSLAGNEDVFYMLVVRASLGTPAHVNHRTIMSHNRRGNFMSPEWDYYDAKNVEVSKLPDALKALATAGAPAADGSITYTATPALLKGIWDHHWNRANDGEKFKHVERVDRVLEELRQKRDFLASGENGHSYKLRSLSTLFVENRFFDTKRLRRHALSDADNIIPHVGHNSSFDDTDYAKKADGGFLDFNIDRQEQLHRSHHSVIANGYGSRTMLANGNHSTPTASGFQYGSLQKSREFIFFQQYENQAMPLLPAYLVAYKRVKQPDLSATSRAKAMQPPVAGNQTDGYSDTNMALQPINFGTSSHWEMSDPYSPLGEHDPTRWRHTMRDYPTIYRFSPYLWGRKTRTDSYAHRKLFDYWNDYHPTVANPSAPGDDAAGRAARTQGKAYHPDETGPYYADGDYDHVPSSPSYSPPSPSYSPTSPAGPSAGSSSAP